jgi:phage terminase large subunit-like protein
LLIDATTGKHRHPVAFDMRVRVAEFTAATERTLADIRQRTLSHDGDLRLRRHVLNARRAPNRYGVSIAKQNRDSPHKIDAAVCVIGARMARRLVLASEKYQRRKRHNRHVVVLR